MRPFKVRLIVAVAVALLVLGAGLVTLAASVSGTDPVFDPCIAFKPHENAQAGTFTKSDGTLTVTFTISSDLLTLDWSSNIPVSHVYVKGGPGGNEYHYTPATDHGTGLVAPDGKEISHVTFYYCTSDPETVTLTVIKNIVNESDESLNNDADHKDVAFTVYVNDTPYTFSASSPLVLTGLAPGSYTVRESTELPPGYSYVRGNQTITIDSETGTGTVTITNRYTPSPEYVTLIVEKNIVDVQGNSLNNDADHKDVAFTVYVNDTPYTFSAASPLVLTGLAPGSFTVRESTELPLRYSYVSGNDTIRVDSETGTGTVTITNKYTPSPEYVTLIVEKNIVDGQGNSLNNVAGHKDMAFTVYVNDTPYTLSASSSLVLNGLTPGSFTVRESTELPPRYSYVGGNQTITINSGTGRVILTNRYTPRRVPDYVTLVVKKHIIDTEGNSLDEESAHKNVSFTVNVNGTSHTVTASSPLVLSGLSPGTFVVSESTEMPADYSYVSGNDTVHASSGTVTVTITNMYGQRDINSTATLIVKKQIIDGKGNTLNNDPDHSEVGFTVTVNGRSYTVSASTPLVLTGLEPGDFTVRETTMPLRYTYVSGNQTVKLTGGIATVTITNRYEPELPITGAMNILPIVLGMLCIGCGVVLLRRMQAV